MIKNDNTKYNFITQVLNLFAVDVLLLIVLTSLVGDYTKDMSSLYRLGSKGLAVSTLLQFLLNAIFIISLKSVFYSDKIFKNMMTLWRTVFMLLGTLSVTAVFIIVFKWFPVDNVYAWIFFFIMFVGGCVSSTLFMIIRIKVKNKKYHQLLSDYKTQHGGDNENESN